MLMPIAIFIGTLIIVIGIVALFKAIERKTNETRRQAVETEASELGLEFSANGSDELQRQVAEFQLFQKGRKRQILNVVSGETDQFEIVIADFHYVTGHGEHQQKHKRTVAMINSSKLAIPEFALRPENLFHKIGSVFGMQDIDFESHREFSRAFLLRGPQEAAIRSFFDDSIIGMLEQHKTICIEAVPGKMIFYFGDRKPETGQLKKLFGEALEIYGHLDDRARALRQAPA